VGISLKTTDLEAAMDEALELARDASVELPANWLKRTEIMGECPAKTYVAVFGAALLAKATNLEVDALALQFKAGPKAFNARNPAGLMWRYARTRRFDFGGTGEDPHQSRPFTNRPRVDDIPVATARESDRKYLEHMVVWLRDLNKLQKREDALAALAAYLRVRTKIYDSRSQGTGVTASAAKLGVLDLARAVESFIRSDPEDGGRGQAAVAAALNAAGRAAKTDRPNAPNRIDVTVREGKRLLLGSEVKQKPVDESIAEELAQRVAASGGDRALLCALAAKQASLDRQVIRQQADALGVMGLVAESVIETFEIALTLGSSTRAEFLESYPGAMAAALEEVGASVDGRRYWSALCDSWAM
jgi:hypothetical protein